MIESISSNYALAGNVAFLLVIGLVVFMFLGRFMKRSTRPDYPEDVVILHQFPRGLRAPSPSPFALKLETWLRMAGIPYQNEFSNLSRSPKGKVPWITLNGVDVSDSQFSIEYLIKKFDKDLSAHLTPYEKSLAHAFLKLNEESLRWVGVVHRFKYGKSEDCGIPYLPFKIVGRKMLKQAEGQGYGKHTQEELYSIASTDIDALETFLAGKKFLMGDKICNEDASMFGAFAQIVNHDRGPTHNYFMEKCPNCQSYYERMKNLYWPDWNNEITEKKSA